ncbi:MAG: DNA internalization-related competence protein ComEC/Rec2 [Gemmatimonadota bacterium]
MALAFAAGALLAQGRIPLPAGPLLLAAGTGLILAFLRPGPRVLLTLAGVAGLAGGAAARSDPSVACLTAVASGPAVLEGRFEGVPGGAPTVLAITHGTCAGARVRALVEDVEAPAGRRVRVHGWWRASGDAAPARLVVQRAEPLPERGLAGAALRLRGRALERTGRTFGPAAPVLEALLLARRERLDPDVSDAFARSGVAHLLAISGFHVGVVAAGVYAALLWLPLPYRPRLCAAVAIVGGYVALLGFPGAATRAALFLGVGLLVRLRGRPVASSVTLAGAALVLLVAHPGWVASPGLQLSFAGIAGLVRWRRPLAAALRPLGLPAPLRQALAANLAATVATAPLVAWHFGEVSVVGVPASLVLTPLAALVITGGLVSLGVGAVTSALSAPLIDLTIRGASLFVTLVEAAAALPWASLPVSRTTCVAALVGAGVAQRLTRRARARVRLPALAAAVVAVPLTLPALQGWGGRGRFELHVIDVGQGDAIALRSPRGRWVLVDAGGRGRAFDAGRDRVVPYLRARGVRRLEALVLSHADLDHSGGAAAVLDALEVGAFLGPGVAAPSEPYRDLLRAAAGAGVPWVRAVAGDEIPFDGVRLSVLAPLPEDSLASLNDRSVVLVARYGSFDALLTGDIGVDVERRLVGRVGPDLEVLKVAHHGSSTSSAAELLEGTGPALALISVGRRNRYGHPDPAVVRRLEGVGARVLRTDRHGSIRVRVSPGGTWQVRVARPGSGP